MAFSPSPGQSPSALPGRWDTDGSTLRPSLRRGSRHSSVGSIGGYLDISGAERSSRKGSVLDLGQNAVFTLLQSPILRTGLLANSAASQRAPSTRDIPPVTLTNITKVDSSVFVPYLSQVGPLYEAFQQAKEAADSDGPSLFLREKEEKGDEFTDLLSKKLRKHQYDPGSPSPKARSPSIASPLSPSFGRKGRDLLAPPPLSSIPTVYFEEDFKLENPRIFDIVSERSDIVPPSSPHLTRPGDANGDARPNMSSGKWLARNAILQEKLSWYMDTVEVHLISSISTASSSFFTALGTLRDLHGEAADAVERIKKLRSELKQVDSNMAVGGLEIVKKKNQRANLQRLRDATRQIKMIVDGVSRCQDLVESGSLSGALDLIEDVEGLIGGTPSVLLEAQDLVPLTAYELFDLRTVKAVRPMLEELAQLRDRIGKAYQSKFIECLVQDLKSHVRNITVKETLQRWGSANMRRRGELSRTDSNPPLYLSIDKTLRQELRSSLNGLSRSNHTMSATAAYREAVVKEIKALIRQPLPSSNDDDAESMVSVSTQASNRKLSRQEKSSILVRNLQALEPDAAEEMLSSMYALVGEAFRRISSQVKLLLDVSSGLASPPSGTPLRSPSLTGQMSSPPPASLNSYLNITDTTPKAVSASMDAQALHQVLDLQSLIGQAVDVAQAQIVRILKVRSENTAALPLQRFLRYFILNCLFADESEAVSGRSGKALKDVVNMQIKSFVSKIGEAERQGLASSMAADPWNVKEFALPDRQRLARIFRGNEADSPQWVTAFRVWEDVEDENVEPPKANGETNGNGAVKKDVYSVILDDEKYMLPESAVVLIRGLERFMTLIAVIPNMTQDVTSVNLEYFRLFNSLSSQLILGAGATKSAGLKHITTKHLALASQSLSFVMAMIPYIREFTRRHVPAGSSITSTLTGEFDRVKRLYIEHQTGIHDKLIDIMVSRSKSQTVAMRAIKWDDSPESTGVSPYMETLAKETSMLHRILSKHLPESTVESIMVPVFANYRQQWRAAFEQTVVLTAAGRERMLRDAQLFEAKIGKIPGAGDLGAAVLSTVESKVLGNASRQESSAPEKDDEKLKLGFEEPKRVLPEVDEERRPKQEVQ